MMKSISKIFKGSAYIFFAGYLIREVLHIISENSYLNTGELMGVESIFLMLWACFIGFLFSALIYGFGVILEYYENRKAR